MPQQTVKKSSPRMRFSHLGPSRCLTISAGTAFRFLHTAPDRGTTPPPHLELTRRVRRAGYGLVSEPPRPKAPVKAQSRKEVSDDDRGDRPLATLPKYIA